MKKKIEESMLILAYAFLLCLCAALLCSNASAENAVDLANTPGHDGWLVCFWENVEPESEDPALIQQDNLLLPVPEL